MIRTAFDQGDELSAAVELRRLFPGITDNAHARARARTIAGWKPLPVTPRPVTALAPRQGSLERLPLRRIIRQLRPRVSSRRASRLSAGLAHPDLSYWGVMASRSG